MKIMIDMNSPDGNFVKQVRSVVISSPLGLKKGSTDHLHITTAQSSIFFTDTLSQTSCRFLIALPPPTHSGPPLHHSRF